MTIVPENKKAVDWLRENVLDSHGKAFSRDAEHFQDMYEHFIAQGLTVEVR